MKKRTHSGNFGADWSALAFHDFWFGFLMPVPTFSGSHPGAIASGRPSGRALP